MRCRTVVLILGLAALTSAASVKPIKDEVKEESAQPLVPPKVETTSEKLQPTKEEAPSAPVKTESTTQTEKLDSTKKEEDNKRDETVKDEIKEERVSYQGSQVIRVVTKNKAERKLIRDLENNNEIETWSGNKTAVDVLIRTPTTLKLLSEKQINYEVVIDNLQRAIDEENPKLSEDEVDELTGRKGHRLTWQMYHRMTDIHGYLDYLAATYPQMVTMTTIGQSVEGRAIKLVKVSSGKANAPAVWADAGIHAREWITPAALTYVISQMVEGGEGTRGVDWYFAPLLNPDGYEYSHSRERLWRKNRKSPEKGACAGIDLNRNFGYRWGGQGASRQPCRETYAGAGAFSEPETAAVQRFITSHGNFKAYVSFHSYGQYILYPWGYDRKVPPDHQDLARVGNAMAAAIKNTGGPSYTVGPAASTLYPASGGSDDWAKGGAKIKYAYTVELRDSGRHGFVLPAQYIVPSGKDAAAALQVLASELTK